MAQQTTLDRKMNNLPLIESDRSVKFKKMLHPILFMLAGTKIKYKVKKDKNYSGKTAQFAYKRPIIFVCNHTTAYDIPIALKTIKEHTILFAAKQPLEKMDEMFFNLNGTVYVDRKNKADMKLSKVAMIETLKRGRNILVYPEGTWNTTDSNLMLEMKWGITEVAKKSNAIIVPLALDYDYDKRVCTPRFGRPLDVSYVSNKQGVERVRESIASVRWKLFEERGKFKRADINPEEERAKIMHSVDEYPKLDFEYEQSVIFHSQPTPEEVFAPIKKLTK